MARWRWDTSRIHGQMEGELLEADVFSRRYNLESSEFGVWCLVQLILAEG